MFETLATRTGQDVSCLFLQDVVVFLQIPEPQSGAPVGDTVDREKNIAFGGFSVATERLIETSLI